MSTSTLFATALLACSSPPVDEASHLDDLCADESRLPRCVDDDRGAVAVGRSWTCLDGGIVLLDPSHWSQCWARGRP